MFKYKTFSGKHLILDLMEIKADFNRDMVGQLMSKICEDYNFTICNISEKQFGDDPRSFTLLYLLSESHFSCHTFPESNSIAFDLYTCSDMSEAVLYWIAQIIEETLGGRGEKNVIRRRLVPSDVLSWEAEHYLSKQGKDAEAKKAYIETGRRIQDSQRGR